VHFNWYHLIPSLRGYPEHVVMGGFCTIIICALCLLAAAVAGKREEALIPDGTLTLRGTFELVVESLSNLSENIIGHDYRPYVAIMGGLFIYIFLNNFLGLVPGFAPATESLNTTLSIGLFSFIMYNFEGCRVHGIKYLKHFLGPVWWLIPLMLPLELVSHVVRPVSLGFRLYGNMMGDHTVLGVFLGLVPIGIPIIFYALGLFVCFVQAFVFTLLSMVYVAMATSHDH
jgi:F-type H+-transporting ATPase subunit a